MKTLCAVLALLGMSGNLLASCRPVVRYHAPYHAPVAVKKVVVADVVAIAAYQPLVVGLNVYGGAYVPPAVTPVAPVAPVTPAPQAGSQSDLQLILTALQSMDARLKAVEGKVGSPAPTPPNLPPVAPNMPATPRPDPFAPRPATAPGGASLTSPAEHPALATFKKACQVCHEASVAREKGGDFVMFTGDKLDLSRADGLQIAKIGSKSYSGAMPKKNSGVAPLTDKEVGEIQDFVDQIKKSR